MSDRLLLFTLREERYALDLQEVAEVMPPAPASPVPWAPPCIRGAINFHGRLVALLDLANFLGMGSFAPDGNVLVLDRGIGNLALWVDRLDQIVTTDGVLEEDKSSDPIVEKVLIMADGEVKKLAAGKLLERVEEALKR